VTNPADRFAYVQQYAYSGADVTIRRYLTLDKFLDLVRTGELHFAPASAMSDSKEGHFTPADQRSREKRLARIGARGLEIARQAWTTMAISNAKTVVLSCWSMGSDEDPRMWSEYAPSRDAIALETSVQALQSALGHEFLAVPVRYVDRDTAELPSATLDALEPFFFKGLDYQWEREVRFIANMEMGKRLATPRRVKVVPSRVPLRFVLAPTASASRENEVRDLLSGWEPGLQVFPSRLRRV
jgi:hypothetical protein